MPAIRQQIQLLPILRKDPLMSNIVNLTPEELALELQDSTIPVLVDFWATWCAPCKAIAPVLEVLATEYAGRLKIIKVDVSDNNSPAETYNFRNIPTMIFFNAGTEVARIVGAKPKSQLVAFIDSHL